jgi:alpha-galactosidase
MKYSEKRAEEISIAYIGGGSREWAWVFMKDLALEEQLSGTIRLFDIDYEAAYNNELIGNRLSARGDVKGKWAYRAVRSIEEALAGADFVIISILPGTFEEMASDVHAPEKYGIYQSVGDTVGPGGMIRALRTIPMFVEIAGAIRRYCPDAWVLNFTNPMTLCTRTLYEVFPDIRAYGCCHEVFGVKKLMKAALKEFLGIEESGIGDIYTNVLGINHFTWVSEASYKGIDLFPLYEKFVEKYHSQGYEEGEEHWLNSYFRSAERVKFDLFRRYGLIAAAGDRHLAEFVPYWYLRNPEMVEAWKFTLTPVSFRTSRREELVQKSLRLSAGKEDFVVEPSGEEGVAQIKALVGLQDLITNVNLPNRGQMEGMPRGAVVETNAVLKKNSVRPLLAGKLPDDVQNLAIRHVLNQEALLKAAMKEDRDLAFRAFINDPQLNTISLGDARSLFEEMLQNTARYLPEWLAKREME